MNRFVEFPKKVVAGFMVHQRVRRLHRFERQLHDARQIQRELLFRRVRHCRDSQFGRDHRFGDIRTLADFRKNVPIARYDYFYPYIKQVTEGNVAAMFPAGEKLLMFALSSGTTGDPKLIPITKSWLKKFREGWQLWGIKAFTDHPSLVLSKMLNIVGSWDIRRTSTDIPCGMASGLSARCQNLFIRKYFAVPPCVFEIEEVLAKYYTMLRLSVVEPVRFLSTATPTTVIRFARLGNEYRETLIRDIADGTLSHQFDISPETRTRIRRRICTPNPRRARELEGVVNRTGSLYPKDYWDLSLLGCWLGGTVGGPAHQIPEYYGDVPCRDIGLLSSEGRFTIPMQDRRTEGVLAITSHYYEFVPEEEIDSSQPTVLECHELEIGRNYFILLTTSSGLYRYNIYDVVRCKGYIGETPLLEFLHKGERFADMEGEKITEYQLVQAVTDASDRLGLTINGFTAVPVRPEDDPPFYAMMVEARDIPDRTTAVPFLECVDRWLSEHNFGYLAKRGDRYLGPPVLVRIPTGSWAAYGAAEVKRRGVSDDHYKHPCLVLDESFLARFPVLETIGTASAVDYQFPTHHPRASA